MDIKLNDKHALVCGSSQGIGFAAAKEIAALGATVTLLARNEQSLIAAREQLPNPEGQQHGILCADFDDAAALKNLLDNYFQKSEDVQILVNNSGGPPGGPIAEASLEEFERTFTRHLKCNHILAQAVLPGMKRSGYGRIINIISTSVKIPLKGLGVSNTIRGAVANWAKTLSFEVAPFGITVNNVLPGATETARLASILSAKAEKSGRSVETVTEEMISAIPAGRFGQPSEIANLIAFLASPAAAYINGTNIPVDGGRTGAL